MFPRATLDQEPLRALPVPSILAASVGVVAASAMDRGGLRLVQLLAVAHVPQLPTGQGQGGGLFPSNLAISRAWWFVLLSSCSWPCSPPPLSLWLFGNSPCFSFFPNSHDGVYGLEKSCESSNIAERLDSYRIRTRRMEIELKWAWHYEYINSPCYTSRLVL